MAKGGFRGGMGGGNMMKQAQKMQEEFMKMQQELESKEFTSTVGGGAVKSRMKLFLIIVILGCRHGCSRRRVLQVLLDARYARTKLVNAFRQARLAQ